jgi:nuclear pore complex protein Nup188
MRDFKEEVLLRAAQFVHTEIWVEYMGWKYISLNERFDIGAKIVGIWSDVLEGFSPLQDGPRGFEGLSNVSRQPDTGFSTNMLL